MKPLLYLLPLLSILSLLFTPVLAQTPTSSPEISDEVIKENIKERLEKVTGQNAGDDDSTLGASSQKRAWVGTLEDITNSTLSIKTKTDTKLADVATDATVVNDERESIKLTALEIGSYVIAMGYLNDDQVLDTRRVAVSEKPTANPSKTFFVSITDIEKKTLTVKDEDNQTWQLSTTSSTTITQTVDTVQSEIQLTDFKVDDKLVIIAKPDTEAPTTLDTLAIHLASQREILADPDSATNSAKPAE